MTKVICVAARVVLSPTTWVVTYVRPVYPNLDPTNCCRPFVALSERLITLASALTLAQFTGISTISTNLERISPAELAMQKAATTHISIVSQPDKRSEVEERWVSFQPYLLSKGYRLRPRYQPDWVPSWRGTDVKPSDCEDSVDSIPVRVLDAMRIQDEQQVMIKMVIPSDDNEGENELELLQHFSSPALRDNALNHVVPCLETFPIPGLAGHFVVMPLLSRYEDIPFYNLAEVHELLRQLFDGLLFMHQNNIAHRDIASPNVMMDARPLYKEPFHPFYQTHSLDTKRLIYPQHRRSQIGIRYYYIDLGYSKWFRDPNAPRTIVGVDARETAPEQEAGLPYDPFLADVYQLGTMLQRDIIPKFNDLKVLLPLALDMAKQNPADRPTLENARNSMNTAFLGLSGWKYRWPIVHPDVEAPERLRFFFTGLLAELRFWMKSILGLVLRRQ